MNRIRTLFRLGVRAGGHANSAQVANSYDYDSFGRRLSAVEAVPQPYGWKAREFLPGPDIYYNRARFYDPVLGRFISEDPLGYEGGDTNLYAFTWNNPRNWSDPSGLSAAGEYGGMAGATTSALARDTVIRGTISSAQQAAALQRIKNLATLSRIAVRIACNLFIASSAAANEGGTVDQENCGVTTSESKPFKDTPKPSPPFKGDPCTTVRGQKKSRTYGEDGYPVIDRCPKHNGEKGIGGEEGGHSHDWGRPPNGGPPTVDDRGVARPPLPGDPPPPRGYK